MSSPAVPPIVLFPLAGFFILRGFWLYDQTLRALYTTQHEDWKKSGKPAGFFLRLPEEASASARSSCTTSWLFRTPSWAQATPAHAKLILKFRIHIFLFWATVLAMGFMMTRMSEN